MLKNYTIAPEFILPGTTDTVRWQSTGCGEFVIGEKGGKRYFIKRYSMGLRYPVSTIAEPAYSQMLAEAQALEDKQAEIRRLCAGLDTDTDHIVVEEDGFWDSNMFVAVSRMIDNENPTNDYTGLDTVTFLTLCRDITTLIKKLHAAGVTHGDLKVKNLLLQNNGGKLVPYLIDFDSSYPTDYCTRKKADGTPMLSYPVVFSDGYESPEIAWYNFNDEGVVPAETITEKTDIFTLAIIFHQLWASAFPSVDAQCNTMGEAVASDLPYWLDKKFDVAIGPKNESTLSALMKWMLEKDSTARPTAAQVLDALNDLIEVDDKYESGTKVSKFDSAPHPVHQSVMDLLSKDELKALGVKAFTRVISGGAYKYMVRLADGSEQTLTVEQVLAAGYGRAKSAVLSDLWPEDAATYEMAPADELDKLNIAMIEKRELSGKHSYYVRFRSGVSISQPASMLVANGIFKRKAPPAPTHTVVASDTPWPEHGSAYNMTTLSERNFTKVERAQEDGENKYALTTTDGRVVVVKHTYMRIMGFIS